MNALLTWQMKSWLFALACRIKPALANASKEKYKGLYDQAKEFLGCKSLTFNGRWLRISRKERFDTAEFHYARSLLATFENEKCPLMDWIQVNMTGTSPIQMFVNHERLNMDWKDMVQVLVPHAQPLSREVYVLAKEIFTTENWETKGILADALEDSCAFEDATHIRDNECTIACPVLQRILKRKL